MKILVTGGAGFIGSHFIEHILNNHPDYKILNLDNLSYCADLNNLNTIENNPGYEFIKGDITDSKTVNDCAKNIDVIVNFAAQTHVDNSIASPKIFFETNVLGTFNLLEAAKNNNIKKFIQISTDEVYGDSKFSETFFENSRLKPNNPYSASKASADLMCRSYYKTYKLPIIITRSSNNFGPRQYQEKLIPFFISKLLKNEKIPLYGNGLQKRDWLFVKENIKAIDLVLHKGKVGEIYNICANCEKTNLEITKIILKELNKSENLIKHTKDRLSHDLNYKMNCDKIFNDTGWKNSSNFDLEITNTINWYIEKFKN